MTEVQELPDKTGYKEPYKYSVSRWKQFGVGMLLFFDVLALLFEHLRPLFEFRNVVLAGIFVVLLYIFSAINAHVHERIHLYVGRLLGYDSEISIKWHHLGGYTKPRGQFVDANHNIINLLAPLFFLGFLYAIALFAEVHWTYSLALTIFLISNTAGSAADVVGAIYDYNLPERSLVYYPESGEKTSFIYEPD